MTPHVKSVAFLFPVSWAVSVKCKEMPVCQAESGSCGNEVMSRVLSWFCLVVEGLASEVRGGQKQFRLFKDSEKHSEILIPNLIFYCSDVWSFWDLVVSIEEFISLYSWVKKMFQWWYLNLDAAVYQSPQLLWFTACCEAKSWACTVCCTAMTWNVLLLCQSGSLLQPGVTQQSREISTECDGPLLWAKSDQFVLCFLLVYTSKCIS